MQTESQPTESGPDLLDGFQRECVDFFVNAASTLSIPRSIGEIYGLLFSTQEPISLDDLTARLRMSRGGAHEGLKWLRTIGAVKVVYIPGVRKEHFSAETSLRRLAAGYLRDRVEPHLENGQNRLRQIGQAAAGIRENGDFRRSRLTQLSNWYKFARRALPAVKTLAGKF